MVVKFSELSLMLKIGIIGGITYLIVYGVSFTIGFIQGIIEGRL